MFKLLPILFLVTITGCIEIKFCNTKEQIPDLVFQLIDENGTVIDSMTAPVNHMVPIKINKSNRTWYIKVK